MSWHCGVFHLSRKMQFFVKYLNNLILSLIFFSIVINPLITVHFQDTLAYLLSIGIF